MFLTVKHMYLLNVTWQPGGEGNLGENGDCICMAESLCCAPETITTLLISCTPIQNLNKYISCTVQISWHNCWLVNALLMISYHLIERIDYLVNDKWVTYRNKPEFLRNSLYLELKCDVTFSRKSH